MEDTDITLQELGKKGRKLGLSYAQSLSLYLFETVLCCSGSLEERKLLWLKEEEFQIQGKKKKRVPNEIIYYMPEISYVYVQEMVERVLKEENHASVTWRLDFYDKELVVDMQIILEQVPIPFKIKIRPIWEKDHDSDIGSYRTILLPEQEICYQKYPAELDLLENLFYIMDRLELIGDMRYYASIYQILRKQSLPGRHLYRDMKEMIKDSHVPSLEKRLETVLSYRKYGYMEKKWNRYIKECGHLNKQDDSWEKVIALMDGCFMPVWQAIEEDVIFIGDWMPQLGRYL